MPAYSNPNASAVVDNVNRGNVDLTKDSGSTENLSFTMGNAAIYGVNTSLYTVSMAVAVEGDIAPNANCTIRAEVNGTLAKELTLTAKEVNPAFSFNAEADDQVVVRFTTSAAGAEEIHLVATRFVIAARKA